MSPNLEDRVRAALEARADLVSAASLTAEPPSDETASPVVPGRRRAVWLAPLLAAAAVVAVATTGSLLVSHQGQPVPKPTNPATELATPTPTQTSDRPTPTLTGTPAVTTTTTVVVRSDPPPQTGRPLSGLSGAVTEQQPAAPTEVIDLPSALFAPDGSIRYPVASRAVADSCEPGGYLTPLAPVYTCNVPAPAGMPYSHLSYRCFVPVGDTVRTRFACLERPWSPSVIEVTVAQAPAPDTSTENGVWALELAGGEQCTEYDGQRIVVDGVTLDYGCGTQGFASAPDRTGDTWTVTFSPSRSGPIRTVAVARAWQ